jgi:hypothetical protein
VPIRLVKEADVKISRASKFSKSEEWNEAIKRLERGIPHGQALKITLSESTLKLFENDKAKALTACRQKLRNEVGDRFRIRIVGDEIAILNKKK